MGSKEVTHHAQTSELVRVRAKMRQQDSDDCRVNPYSKSLILKLSFGTKFKTEGKILGRWRVNCNFVFKLYQQALCY